MSMVASEDRSAAVANFVKLGLALGVETATFESELGRFEGYLRDEVIFKYSLLDGFTWSYSLQDFLLTKLFPNKIGTYIDVGANIGLVVIPVAEKGGIQCYAFEPEPSNYALLRRNIVAHHVESLIQTYPIALFSKKTTLPFEICYRNFGDHRIRPNQPANVQEAYREAERKVIAVQAERLDDVLDASQLEKPIVMKVDIQGAEVQFFKGATKFLPFVDYLVIEYSPYMIQYLGDNPESIFEIVQQFPFASTVDTFDRVRSVEIALKPIEQVLESVRIMFDLKHIDPEQAVDIICSRTSVLPSALHSYR